MACYENSSSVLILQMSPEFYKLEVQRLCYTRDLHTSLVIRFTVWETEFTSNIEKTVLVIMRYTFLYCLEVG